jgi:hypothetical protein
LQLASCPVRLSRVSIAAGQVCGATMMAQGRPQSRRIRRPRHVDVVKGYGRHRVFRQTSPV